MINIVASFVAGEESTFAALRLADHFLASGADVRLLAPDGGVNCGHPLWQPVLRGRQCLRGLRPNDVVINCGVDPAQMPAPGPRWIFALDWDRQTPRERSLACAWPIVVGPSLSLLRHGGNDQIGFAIAWDAGVPPLARSGRLCSEQTQVVLWFDRNAIHDWTMSLDYLLSRLLAHPTLVLHLLHWTAWPRESRRILHRLVAASNRVRVTRIASYAQLSAALHTADILALPCPARRYGWPAALARGFGLPLVAYDLPPYDELHGQIFHGVCVPLSSGTIGWVSAVANLATDPAELARHQLAYAQPDDHAANFMAFWDGLL